MKVSQSLILSLCAQKRANRTEADMSGPKERRSNADSNMQEWSEKQGKEEEKDKQQKERVILDQDSNTDLELGGTEKVDFE